jgi:endonuclease YncB( thermonuclease family)
MARLVRWPFAAEARTYSTFLIKNEKDALDCSGASFFLTGFVIVQSQRLLAGVFNQLKELTFGEATFEEGQRFAIFAKDDG